MSLVVTDVLEHPPTSGLGTWLVASHREGRPVTSAEVYPCRCLDVDDEPPGWKLERAQREGKRAVLRCDPYLARKGRLVGRWANRCDCWGRRRDDTLPGHCCSRHEGNPAYATTSALGIEALTADESGGYPLGRMLGNMAEADRQYGHDGVHVPDDDLERLERMAAPWFDHEPDPEPYVRTWSAAEVTCPCRTPWDAVKDARQCGYHCVSCHNHFKSWAVARAHQRNVTDPCKDPARQLNVDQRPVFRVTTVGGFVVWA